MAGHSYDVVVLSSSPPAASPQYEAAPRRVAMPASSPLAFSPAASPIRTTAGASRVNSRAAPIPEGAVRGFATVGSLVRSEHFTTRIDNERAETNEAPPPRELPDVVAPPTVAEKPKRRYTKKATTVADESEKPKPKPRARKPKPKSDREIPDSEDELRLPPRPIKSHFFDDKGREPPLEPQGEAANAPKLTKTGKLRKSRAKKQAPEEDGEAPIPKPRKTRVAKPKAAATRVKGGKQHDASTTFAHFQDDAHKGEGSAGLGTRARTEELDAPVENPSIWDVPESPRPKTSATIKQRVPSPVAEGLDLEEAGVRRRDWTPPRDTTIPSPFTNSTGKENKALVPGAGGAFTSMISNFAYAQPPLAQPTETMVDSTTEGTLATKRRRVELVEIRSNQINSRDSSPEKGKATKKKPRTITDLMTEKYAVKDAEPVTGEAFGAFFEPLVSTTKILLNDTSAPDTNVPLKKPLRKRKSASDKADSKAKSKKTSTKSAKQMHVEEKLLSPTSALSRLSKQDVLFGTSSQLVLDESPTTIRQIQSAIKESEQDSNSFAAPAPLRWPKLDKVQSKRGLWAASSRDDKGRVLEHMSDVYIPEPDRTQDIPLLMDGARDKPDEIADDASSFIDIDDIVPDPPSAILISSDLPTPPRNPSRTSQTVEHSNDDYEMTDVGYEDIDNFEQAPPPSNQNADPDNSFIDIDDIDIPLSAHIRQPPTMKLKPPAPMSVTDNGSPKKRGRPPKSLVPIANVSASSTPSLKPLPPKAKTKSKEKAKSPATPLKSLGRFIDIDEILDSEDEGLAALSPTPPRVRKLVDSGPLPLILRSPTTSPSKAKKPSNHKDKAPLRHADITPVYCIATRMLEWTHIKASVFSQLTSHIRSLPPTTDPTKPSWHEKILMYDPIVLEDFTQYINAHTSIRVYKKATQKQAKAWNQQMKADGEPLLTIDKDGDDDECDEERPKCGSCRKKDRPCMYSYGKLSAFVVQDPKHLTKYGKSRTTPIVYSISASEDETTSSSYSYSPEPSELRITTERHAENGQGFFQTLAPRARSKAQASKKKSNIPQRALEAYLQQSKESSAVVAYSPVSPETTLISRYIGMLGSDPVGKQPLAVLGTWIQSIPSRIGSNRVLDLAAEFLVNSYAAYRDGMHSKRKLAAQSKAKALRELQLVVLGAQSKTTYDVILATKMHFAAEALVGIDTMYHAIHAFGLAQLLKSGTVSDVDDEHFWNLIDNTYIDDVNEAMLAGRKSVYDNDFYLSATYPPPIDSNTIPLSASQRASIAIMHVFIQCPRAVYSIRHAILNPDDAGALAAAVSHMESLIQVDLSQHVSELMQTAVSTADIPPCPEIADIMPDTLKFDSVQSMILCTRYWMLQNVLCGLADSLYRHFPAEAALSLIPPPDRLRIIDIDSALHLAKSLRWADSISQNLPLVPLRLHTPLQISIGPWYRTLRNPPFQQPFSTSNSIPSETAFELSRATRMKAWIIAQCNLIHTRWDVSTVDESPLLEALDAMAGEPIPDWLPIRVRFEAEDGEMVMKLDYENKTGSYSERYDVSEPPRRERMPHPGIPGQEWQRENLGVQELAFRGEGSGSQGVGFNTRGKNACLAPSWSTRAVDVLHSTGRNLCSTSGWWPENERTGTVLLDSTHKASAFSGMRKTGGKEAEDIGGGNAIVFGNGGSMDGYL
ncbi:Structure-specific endonuclease protein [Pyrenophora teres f. maculata]|nr:Structure-specific endonuclease protein [Pyrenophora teres f. maculata]